MSRVVAVVEGWTEQSFIRDVLAPVLLTKNVYLSARLVGKPGHKGGVGPYQRARRDFIALLKQETETIITSMFDFYGMPASWPGRQEAQRVRHDQKPREVEAAIKEDIAGEFEGAFDTRRLMPYVQMYEYEALLFSKPSALSDVLRSPCLESDLQEIRDEFDTPEEINDGHNTAPSKRIQALYRFYRKPLHGVLAAQQITVDVMRVHCPHFNDWVTEMESLGSL